MKTFNLTIALLLLSGCLTPPKEEVVIVRLVRVVDGDTFIADIERGYPKTIARNIGIRIAGIDMPELKDKRPEIKKLAYEARDFVKKRLSKAKRIELKNFKKGKYFRIVADVYIDGKNISDELLAKGYAKDGKKKEPRFKRLIFIFNYYSFTSISQPCSSGCSPNWIPVMRSYSFFRTGPISLP